MSSQEERNANPYPRREIEMKKTALPILVAMVVSLMALPAAWAGGGGPGEGREALRTVPRSTEQAFEQKRCEALPGGDRPPQAGQEP